MTDRDIIIGRLINVTGMESRPASSCSRLDLYYSYFAADLVSISVARFTVSGNLLVRSLNCPPYDRFWEIRTLQPTRPQDRV